MDLNFSGEGVNFVLFFIKRGLFVDFVQEVKCFRMVIGVISVVFGRSQLLFGVDFFFVKFIDKQYIDIVVNFFICVVCQVNDNINMVGFFGEVFFCWCVNFLKIVLWLDMWFKFEFKLQWFDKLLMIVEQLN